MSTSSSPQFNRTFVYVSLGMVLLLIVGALVGARMIADRAGNQPVAMSDLPAPDASSPECTELIDALPDSLLGHDRAEIAEPIPAGVAAWQSSSTERVTLRCGVELPFQYTDYAVTENIDGVEWLRVDDMTPESDLTTWYTVDRAQVVAVTADGNGLGRADEPVSDLTEQVTGLAEKQHEKNPAPLTELEKADGNVDKQCLDLKHELPDDIADGWSRVHDKDLPTDTAVWTNAGAEPIVMRCGVAPPPNYESGERLTQIDEIPWFEDDRLVNGSTASYWYALGRATDIAVSVPQAAASEALPQLGTAIETATDPQ